MHRRLLLAASQAVLQTRRTLPARRRPFCCPRWRCSASTRAVGRSLQLSTNTRWQSEQSRRRARSGTPEQNAGLLEIRARISCIGWARRDRAGPVRARRARAPRAPARPDPHLLPGRPDGSASHWASRVLEVELAFQHPACMRLRRAGALLDVPDTRSSAIAADCRPPSPRESAVLERAGYRRGRRGAPRLPAAPAGRRRRRPAPAAQRRRVARVRQGRVRMPATSATSSACSSTCAGRRKWPKGACRSTPSSSSTGSSRRSRMRSSRPADSRTSSWAMGCLRSSGSRRSRTLRVARRLRAAALIGANVDQLNRQFAEDLTRADPVRHRHPRRRGHRRRHRLSRQRRLHRVGGRRQRYVPIAGHDEEPRLRSGVLGRSARARRDSSRKRCRRPRSPSGGASSRWSCAPSRRPRCCRRWLTAAKPRRRPRRIRPAVDVDDGCGRSADRPPRSGSPQSGSDTSRSMLASDIAEVTYPTPLAALRGSPRLPTFRSGLRRH